MNKTPVALLGELAVKHALELRYQELSPTREGTVSIFKIEIHCNGNRTEGSAMTKKNAKHDAARKMLQLLGEKEVIPSSLLIHLDKDEQSNSILNSPSLANYVGLLNEFCQQRGLPLPNYSTSVIGITQPSMFITTCSIGGTSMQGKGSTKKASKQVASEEVFKYLNDTWKHDMLSKSDLNNSNTTELIEKLGFQIDELRLNEKTVDIVEKDNVQSKYAKLKNKPNINPKLIGEQHRKIGTLVNAMTQPQKDTIVAMQSNKTNSRKNDVERAICNGLRVTGIQKFILHGKNKGIFLASCKVQTEPPILQISGGSTIEAAEMSALNKILDLIVSYMDSKT